MEAQPPGPREPPSLAHLIGNIPYLGHSWAAYIIGLGAPLRQGRIFQGCSAAYSQLKYKSLASPSTMPFEHDGHTGPGTVAFPSENDFRANGRRAT